MNIDGVSAAELAKIDAVAVDFESEVRQNDLSLINDIAITDTVIDQWVDRYDGAYPKLMRSELRAIVSELRSKPIAPRPKSKIGPYVVEDVIGRGGMGIVYRATDTRSDETVAIKMLATDLATSDELNQRFQRESRSIAAIAHPNIVSLLDVGSHGVVPFVVPFVVMEFLAGETLSEKLSLGPLETKAVRDIGCQIASALTSVHAADIVHRDLTPRNIMLVSEPDSPPITKLFDFGLSRVPRHSLDEVIDDTHEGTIMGTPGYMAPEQSRGEAVTSAADIFSLGCVLFECFYHGPAFPGSTNAVRMAATLSRDPAPDSARRRDDPALAAVIDVCLNKDAASRPTAAEVAVQLR